MKSACRYVQLFILIVQPCFLWFPSQGVAFEYSVRVLDKDLGSYHVDSKVDQFPIQETTEDANSNSASDNSISDQKEPDGGSPHGTQSKADNVDQEDSEFSGANPPSGLKSPAEEDIDKDDSESSDLDNHNEHTFKRLLSVTRTPEEKHWILTIENEFTTGGLHYVWCTGVLESNGEAVNIDINYQAISLKSLILKLVINGADPGYIERFNGRILYLTNLPVLWSSQSFTLPFVTLHSITLSGQNFVVTGSFDLNNPNGHLVTITISGNGVILSLEGLFADGSPVSMNLVDVFPSPEEEGIESSEEKYIEPEDNALHFSMEEESSSVSSQQVPPRPKKQNTAKQEKETEVDDESDSTPLDITSNRGWRDDSDDPPAPVGGSGGLSDNGTGDQGGLSYDHLKNRNKVVLQIFR